jgi:hypothetical protein
MKLLIIVSFIAAAGLLAALNDIPRHSGSTVGRAGATGTTLYDTQSSRLASELPAEDFDDRSLVFPRESKR